MGMRIALQRSMMLSGLAVLSGVTMSSVTLAQKLPGEISLMPEPQSMTRGSGELLIDPTFKVELDGYVEPRLNLARERFFSTLSRETGITVWKTNDHPTELRIVTAGASKPVQQVGEDESYHLEVTSAGAELKASNPLGVLHGLQTLLQLVAITPRGFVIPAVTIDDAPRFVWRGMMIDTSRHFMPVETIERNLDGMEAVKMNVFHWHLSDDQGFRAESHVYPLLQGKGSDGQFYTQEQMKKLVAYARDRGIRVVPEFDMPGHTTAWLVGYPELGSGKGPYAIERKWGIFNPAMDPTRETTYRFIDKLIGEMVAIFPDAYFHVGGDECNGKEWDANPRIQEYMKQHGFKNDAALQGYFSSRVQRMVAQHGKIPAGWDEILQPTTAKNVLIQSWHGPQFVMTAARQGNDVILSKGYYLDLILPAAEHYMVDPLGGTAALTPEEQKHVLGGESAMWSELVSTENIDGRIWPRNGAIAERLWSPAEKTQDIDSMYRRLEVLSHHLQAYGLQHASVYPEMLERMAGTKDIQRLKVLGDVVEPPKHHERAQHGSYDAFTPLNRMVDAISPESMQAREFEHLCVRISAGTATDAEHDQARELLTQWRDNDALLAPQLGASSLTAELIPVSSSLRVVAQTGLEALGYLEGGKGKATAEWRDRSLQELQVAGKQQAGLMLMVVGPVRELVMAASASTDDKPN